MKKIIVMVSVAAIAAALVTGCGKKEATPASTIGDLKEKAGAAVQDASKKADAAVDDAAKKADAAATDAAKKTE